MPAAYTQQKLQGSHFLREGSQTHNGNQFHRGGLMLGDLPSMAIPKVGFAVPAVHNAISLGIGISALNVSTDNIGGIVYPEFVAFTPVDNDLTLECTRFGNVAAGVLLRVYDAQYHLLAESLSDAAGLCQFIGIGASEVQVLPLVAGAFDATVLLTQQFATPYTPPTLPLGTPAEQPIPPAQVCNTRDGSWFYDGVHFHAQECSGYVPPVAPAGTAALEPIAPNQVCNTRDGSWLYDGAHFHNQECGAYTPPSLPLGTPAEQPIPPVQICSTRDGSWFYNGLHHHAQACGTSQPPPTGTPHPAAPPTPLERICNTRNGSWARNGLHFHIQECDFINPDTPGEVYDPIFPLYAPITREPLHLLPPNALSSERNLSISVARAGHIPAAIRPLWNVDYCPRHLLTWMAWGLSVDVWADEWSENRKREVLRAAISIHQKKGTIGAIKSALDAMGYTNATVDDTNPSLPPFHFSVLLGADAQVNGHDMATITERVNQFKNARSQLHEVRFVSLFHDGTATRDGTYLYSGDII